MMRLIFLKHRLGSWLRCPYAVAVMVCLAGIAQAELTVVEEETDAGSRTVYQMTVSPAAEPIPALKHRLVSREIDYKSGNAAPYYYRALMGLPRIDEFIRKKFGDEYYDWIDSGDTSLNELPVAKVREACQLWEGSVLDNLRAATMRRSCDWEWNLQEIRGHQLITFLLEEIQQGRTLSRALSLRTRVALLDRDYEQAISELRTNYRLGRDVAKEPLLICDLVGIAICNIGNRGVIEFIAQPNAPNLYWALAELPMIDVRESMRNEMSLGLRIFPFILNAETAEHSSEEWARLMSNALMQTSDLFGGSVKTITQQQAEMGVAGLTMLSYPAAKLRLIESGMQSERVEKMPVGQVVSIDALREYRRIADSLEKWNYVPYRDARNRDIEKELQGSPALGRGYGYLLANSLLPAVQKTRRAEQRLGGMTKVIQTVEAIRMHAAETGKLPSSLNEISIVPLPINPITDELFRYQMDGEIAVLELSLDADFHVHRFEISLAP